MCDNERSIALRFITHEAPPWCLASKEFINSDHSSIAKRVLEGLRLYRVHILPVLLKLHNLEPDGAHIRHHFRAIITIEENYCDGWATFHTRQTENIGDYFSNLLFGYEDDQLFGYASEDDECDEIRCFEARRKWDEKQIHYWQTIRSGLSEATLIIN